MRFVFLDYLATKPYTPSTPYKEGIGGTQSAICYYCEYLGLLGHDITLINGITNECTDRGVKVKPLKSLESSDKQDTDVLVMCGGTGTHYINMIHDKFNYTISIAWHGHHMPR